jgi:hypothetical protein
MRRKSGRLSPAPEALDALGDGVDRDIRIVEALA